MKNLLATAAAAIIALNEAIFKGWDESRATEYCSRHAQNVVSYFKDHKEQTEFFATSDLQVFREEGAAFNHSSNCEDKTVVCITRECVAALIGAPAEGIEAKLQAAGGDYSAMNVGQLRELCKERNITYKPSDIKATLVKLLLSNLDAPLPAAPATEMPEAEETETEETEAEEAEAEKPNKKAKKK